MNKFLEKLILDVQASGQKFASSERHDPYRDFNFRVEIVGKKTFTKAGFQKISGLKVQTEVIEYRDGADRQLTDHKLAGRTKYEPVTFERGMSQDSDIMDWIMQQIIQANDDKFKATIKIHVMDRDNKTIAKTWEILEAWPSDYETGEWDAQGNGVSIDRMIIQHEGIKFSGKTIQ